MNYHEFRQEYEEQHPASIPQYEPEMHEYPGWVRWAVLAGFIAAAMVSGVHTIPTVWASIRTGAIITEAVRNGVSVASLFAVELAILLSAYLMAKGVRLAYTVMGMASLVAIAANLYAVVTAFQENTTDAGALAVAFILGVCVPMITLFMGKMFVDIHRADRVQDARAKKAFREASIAWDKEIERAWKGYQKSNVQLSNDMSNGRNGQVAVSPSRSLLGHTKNPDASEIVRKHLSENPEDMNLSPRQLGALLDVGKSTVNNVQREMRQRTVEATNGHKIEV